ncbi:hypothetical protein ACWGQQ_01705 [Bradyrhizobium sp. Lot33]
MKDPMQTIATMIHIIEVPPAGADKTTAGLAIAMLPGSCAREE